MEFLFFELADLLARQSNIIKAQLAASKEQNRALRRVDSKALERAVKNLEELTLQMAELDRRREAVQQKLERALGLNKGATVTEMLPRAPLKLIITLKELIRELKKDIRQLDESNELNNLLTRRLLQINENYLEILKSGGDKKTYQDSGSFKQGQRSTVVFDKTV